MSYVFTASRLMTVSEVLKACEEMRENNEILIEQEEKAKNKLFGTKEKAAS